MAFFGGKNLYKKGDQTQQQFVENSVVYLQRVQSPFKI